MDKAKKNFGAVGAGRGVLVPNMVQYPSWQVFLAQIQPGDIQKPRFEGKKGVFFKIFGAFGAKKKIGTCKKGTNDRGSGRHLSPTTGGWSLDMGGRWTRGGGYYGKCPFLIPHAQFRIVHW